jgi:hypothetical protein
MAQITAFVTLDQALTIVATSELRDQGAWSPDGYYYPRDAVLFSNAYYSCIKENTNKLPSISPDEWLLLVFVTSGSEAHTADEAYALAEQAYSVAVSGTNGIAHAEALAYQALLTAWAGTNAASAAQTNAGNALNIANQAYLIAINGTTAIEDTTDLAYKALQTAWSGTSGANSAMSVAVAGTQAASSANALALVALQTAWLGTVSYGSNGWSGTLFIDLAGPTYQQRPVAADTHIVVINPQVVRGVTAVLVSETGASAALSFNPTDMSWFGSGMPTALAAGKRMIINFTSFGSTGSEIHAAYTQQA